MKNSILWIEATYETCRLPSLHPRTKAVVLTSPIYVLIQNKLFGLFSHRVTSPRSCRSNLWYSVASLPQTWTVTSAHSRRQNKIVCMFGIVCSTLVSRPSAICLLTRSAMCSINYAKYKRKEVFTSTKTPTTMKKGGRACIELMTLLDPITLFALKVHLLEYVKKCYQIS